MDRVPRDAALASAPTWSTPGSPWRNRRSEASEPTASARCEGRARPAAELAVELVVAVTGFSIGGSVRLGRTACAGAESTHARDTCEPRGRTRPRAVQA